MPSGVSIPISLVDQVSSDLGHIRNKLDDFSKASTSVKFGMGAAAGALAVKAFTGAMDDGVRAVVDMAQAAMAEDAQIAKLTQTIRANVKGWDGNEQAVEDVINSRKRLAFSDDAMRDSLNRLIPVTRDVGKAFDVQRVAMDLARMKGIDLESASDKIAKALLGNKRVLKELGIELDAGATKTQVLAEIQRVAAGQAETYAAQTEASVERLGLAFEDLKEDAGRQVMFWADDFARGLGAVAYGLSDLGLAFEDYNDYLRFQNAAMTKNVDVLEEYGDTMGELAAANREAKPALQVFSDGADDAAEATDRLTASLKGARDAWDLLNGRFREDNEFANLPDKITVARDEAKTALGELNEAIEGGNKVAIAAARIRLRDAQRELRELERRFAQLRLEIAQPITVGDVWVSPYVGRPAPRAGGGPVTGGRAYVVGERGPELFIPRASGTIVPNSMATSSGTPMAAPMTSRGNVTININGAQDVSGIMLAIKRELARQNMTFS